MNSADENPDGQKPMGHGSFDLINEVGDGAEKITCMIMLMIIKESDKGATFVRQRGPGNNIEITIIKDEKNFYLIEPPSHMSQRIFRALRHVSREAAKNPESPFKLVYTETGHEQKVEWNIDRNSGKDLLKELYRIVLMFHRQEAGHIFDRIEIEQKARQAFAREAVGCSVAIFFLILICIFIRAYFFLPK